MPVTPTQGQLLAKYRAEAHVARKRRFHRVIGIGLGAAGLATALVGMPMLVSLLLWGCGIASWQILKAI